MYIAPKLRIYIIYNYEQIIWFLKSLRDYKQILQISSTCVVKLRELAIY